MKKILLLFVPLFLSLTLGATYKVKPPYPSNGSIKNETDITFNFTIDCSTDAKFGTTGPNKIPGTVGPKINGVLGTKNVTVCTGNINTITARGIDPKTNKQVNVTGYFAPGTSEQVAGPNETRQWTITTNASGGYVINAG